MKWFTRKKHQSTYVYLLKFRYDTKWGVGMGRDYVLIYAHNLDEAKEKLLTKRPEVYDIEDKYID